MILSALLRGTGDAEPVMGGGLWAAPGTAADGGCALGDALPAARGEGVWPSQSG